MITKFGLLCPFTRALLSARMLLLSSAAEVTVSSAVVNEQVVVAGIVSEAVV